MIDGIANTGAHTFVEKNKIFPIDIHLHVHSHSMRHYLFRWGITSWMVVKCRNVGKSAAKINVGKCVNCSDYYGATIVGPTTQGNFAETSGERSPCQRRR